MTRTMAGMCLMCVMCMTHSLRIARPRLST